MIQRSILILCILAGCGFHIKAQTAGDYKMKSIVLDAGHGGHDTGCRGVFSNEKDVTLKIVLKVGELMKQTYPGIKVIYTRKTDEFIELYERADIANRNDADLFISIHCNANKSHVPFGTETWLMGLKKSEGNLEVSKRENDVVLLENDYQEHYNGFDPNSPEGYIILTMNQNAHITQSIGLASKVEDQFRLNGRTSRGVKQAGFLVLWRTTMPSILIETGFLTNREEEKYLNSEKGQNEIARSILNAITAYRNEVEGISESGGGIGDSIAGTRKSELGSVTDSSIITKDSDIAIKDPELKPKDSLLVYRIQITASSNPLNLKDPKFASFKEIRNDKSESGMNRYVVGNYLSRNECMKDLDLIRKKGFKDAFMVSYKFEKRVQ